MAHNTIRLGLNVADATDNVSAFPVADNQSKAILDNAVTVTSGTLAARPGASLTGRRYYATDTSQDFLDTGSAWQLALSPGQALQLAVTGTNRQIKFGGPVSVSAGLDAQPSRSSTNGTVAHGMGLTPIWAMVLAAGRVAIQETSYTVVPAGAVTALDGTNISYSWTINGTSNNGFAFYWVAVA